MDVIALRNEAIRLRLDLTKDYLQAPYQILNEVCNGVGPEWFPDWVREKVTDYFEYFLTSTNQHDFDFEFLFKSKVNFKIANNRLYKNMKLQISEDSYLSWFSISKKKSKWRKKLQARFLYKMCVRFGESAFFKEEVM